MEKRDLYTPLAFGSSIMALSSIVVPVISIVAATAGLIFFLLSKKSPKTLAWAALGMCILALILDAVYLVLVLSGRG